MTLTDLATRLFDGEPLRGVDQYLPRAEKILRIEAFLEVNQPRCDKCMHWQILIGEYLEPSGTCALHNGPNGSVWSDCGDWTIITAGNFGCVKWEALK